jgi:hypothetical protein
VISPIMNDRSTTMLEMQMAFFFASQLKRKDDSLSPVVNWLVQQCRDRLIDRDYYTFVGMHCSTPVGFKNTMRNRNYLKEIAKEFFGYFNTTLGAMPIATHADNVFDCMTSCAIIRGTLTQLLDNYGEYEDQYTWLSSDLDYFFDNVESGVLPPFCSLPQRPVHTGLKVHNWATDRATVSDGYVVVFSPGMDAAINAAVFRKFQSMCSVQIRFRGKKSDFETGKKGAWTAMMKSVVNPCMIIARSRDVVLDLREVYIHVIACSTITIQQGNRTPVEIPGDHKHQTLLVHPDDPLDATKLKDAFDENIAGEWGE